MTTLAVDLFAFNPLLVQVEVDGSELTSLPAGLFRHNPLLRQVSFQSNRLTSAGLPDGLFDYTRENSMFLYLGSNPIGFLREGFFHGLSRPTSGTIELCVLY